MDTSWKLKTPYYLSDGPAIATPPTEMGNHMASNLSIDLPNRLAAIEASLNLNIPSRQIGHMGHNPQCSGGSTPILNPPRGSQPTTPMHVYGVSPSGHMTPMADTMMETWARMPTENNHHQWVSQCLFNLRTWRLWETVQLPTRHCQKRLRRSTRRESETWICTGRER